MRTRILLTALPLLCSGAILLGCGSPLLRDMAPAVAVSDADEHYLQGRSLHLARRHEEAIAAYQAALRIAPAHVNASNGLAIAYAEQRDFARAIPIWRELTRGATMGSGQPTAFLFGNLGYAYFLNGDYELALVAFEKTCLLDPLNGRAWQYLGETLQKLGQDERASQMLRQASALREHDFQADYAAASGGARLPALEKAVQTAAHTDQEWAFVEVTSQGNGVLELRRVTPAAPARKPPLPPLPLRGDAPPAIIAALEISNGNGRQGLARMVSRQIRDPGVKIVRLTNEKGFKVRQTRIEFQPAFRDLAERLAQRFGAQAPVEIRAGDKARARADIRLVIGRDLPPQRIAARSNALSGVHGNVTGAP
jgi:tetratricopeptide (TPR) repeat protein